MKKPIASLCMLLTLLFATAGISAKAQTTTREFTVAASNVDGLPPSVHINYGVGSTDVKMNPDGSEDRGATRMGQLFAERLWDIVALSEDFNYHNYIMDGVSKYYVASTYRGKIEQSNLNGSLLGYLTQSVAMDTDGLCLLTRKTSQMLEEKITKWSTWYGYTDHEADGLIEKGYRFYQICLEGDLIVDVYIMHMDAGSDDGDISARTAQLQQLVKAIKASDNKNPIIILGDTNCRYTRDTLKADLIDAINADSRFEIHDPWVDFMWGGVYPEYGSGSIMTDQYGQQKGEVVDKIWYINNTESQCTLRCNGYLHDDTFTYPDGSQIADHFPVVAEMVIEGPATSEPPAFEYPEAPAKTAIKSGSTYFVRNLGSGKFLRAGGAWTTQAVMGDYPSKITPTASGSGYTLKTTHRNGNSGSKYYLSLDGTSYYMDQASNVWTLTQVKDNVYTMKDASGNAVGFEGDELKPVSENTSDPNQQWEFLTQADLINELYYATVANPKDATFLMKCADFGYADQETWDTMSSNSLGSRYSSVEKVRLDANNNISFWKAVSTSNGSTSYHIWKLKQTISGLPAGVYKVSYQCATYNLPKGGKHDFTINGAAAPWTDLSSDPGNATIAADFGNGLYTHEVTVTVSDSGTYPNQIVISVDKGGTDSATGAYYDNFKIKCIAIEGKIDEDVYAHVKAAIDDAREKANEMGLAFNNRAVETLWRNHEIVGDGWDEVNRTYKNLAEAVLSRTVIPSDYTYALINNSFELYPDYKDNRYNIDGAYPFAWSYPTKYAKDSGVWPASDPNKAVSNPDGDYIFNTWEWGDPEAGGYQVYQKVALTPGIYKLSAKVASHNGYKVYLFAGDNYTSVTTKDKGEFTDISFNFMLDSQVGDGIEIGVVGADANGNFNRNGTDLRFYKADDFHLMRIGDEETVRGMEMLSYAIKETTERMQALGLYDSDKEWRDAIAVYQAMLDNFTLTGDGKQEFNEVYDLFRTRLFAIENREDYTYALANPSFEWGNTYGWDLKSNDGDTGVKPNSDGTYTMSGCDGTYVFNTWRDGSGTVISQTINNLPSGHYVLYATYATDENNAVFLEARDAAGSAMSSEIYSITKAKNVGEQKMLEFDVAEGTPSVTLVAGGAKNSDGTWVSTDLGGIWYKVDNFRLIRQGDANVCVFYRRLQNAIDDANAIAARLPKYYADQWDVKDYQDLVDEHHSDGHNSDNGESGSIDPMHSDGSEQIAELYSRLRELIFSQQEAGADMTGAITNHSFELGDLTGWSVTPKFSNNDYRVKGLTGETGYDGKYVFNCYEDWPNAVGRPITQVIPNVPAGKYKITFSLASYGGNHFFFGANYWNSEVFAYDGNGDMDLRDYSFEFEVSKDVDFEDVKIGLYPTYKSSASEINLADFDAETDGPWYKIDNFRLELVSRWLEVDWVMETDTHGTIMLPFDVSKEELDSKNLEAYTILKSEQTLTPADDDVNNYRLLKWEGPHTEGMKANNPYVLKNVAPKADVAAVAETEGKHVYRFEGYTNIKEYQVENYLLTGTLVDVPATDEQHHLQQIGDNVGFMKHANADDNGVSHDIVEAYHAYMLNPREELRSTDGFYFREPVQTIEWAMETPTCGTIILPFDAEFPKELTPYRLTGKGAPRNIAIGTDEGGTYCVIEKAEVTDKTENGLVKLEANVPYFVVLDNAKAAAKRKVALADTETYTCTFSGVATNSEAEYKYDGLLTGVFVSRDDNKNDTQNALSAGHCVLTSDENGGTFQLIEGSERLSVNAYHAYIDVESAGGSYLLAETLVDYLTWTMETAEFGTIILPFEAEIPSDLEAYALTGVGTDAPTAIPGTENCTYQILTKITANSFEPNKPYVVLVKPKEIAPILDDLVPEPYTLTFEGSRGESDTPETGTLLTGTYSDTPVSLGDYVVSDNMSGFEMVTSENTAVEGLHAYISKSLLSGSKMPDFLLFEKPSQTGIETILNDDAKVDIYTLSGIKVAQDVAPAEGLRTLAPGIYILRSGNTSVKVLK